MTVQQAEDIIARMHTGVKIAYTHRFAGDKGTILRLDNYAMINIFDDGRYYIQGDNTDELIIAFGRIQEAWDPDSWTPILSAPAEPAKPVLRWIRPTDPDKRFEF
jgi:hypothetical protein